MALLCNTKMDLDQTIPLWHNADMQNGNAPNKIRELREAMGWSQQELADALSPKTTQPQIDRLEKGERKLSQDWMNKIAAALKVEAADLLPNKAQSKREQQPVDNTQRTVVEENVSGLKFQPGAQSYLTWPKDIKIVGHVRAGKLGFFLDQGETHGMAYRPPNLSTVKDAFAVYVQDDSMDPKFETGEIAWVHPTRPVTPGDNIIIEMHDGQAFIKKLVRRTEKFVFCKQWNPLAETKYDQSKVKRLYYVVGSYRED